MCSKQFLTLKKKKTQIYNWFIYLLFLNINENRFKIILLIVLRSPSLTQLHPNMVSQVGNKEVHERPGLWEPHKMLGVFTALVNRAAACVCLQTKGG